MLLDAQVDIRDVTPELFNKITLREVVVSIPQSGDTILTANKLAANLELLPLLQKRLVINNIQLLSFNFRLQRDSLGAPLNIDPIIQKLRPKQPNEKGLVELQLRSILLRRGKFSYDVTAQPHTPHIFNKHHIQVENLLASVSLRTFSNDSINARLKRLSFTEQSGLELRKLALELVGNRDSLRLTEFECALPYSYITLGALTMDMSAIPKSRIRKSLFSLNRDDLHLLADSARTSFELRPSFLKMADLAPLSPPLSLFPFTLKLEAHAEGSLNDLTLHRLQASAQEHFYLDASFKMSGITHWHSAYLFGQIHNFYFTPEASLGVVQNFSPGNQFLTSLCNQAGVVHFKGDISGFRDDLIAKGALKSDIGSVETRLELKSHWEEGILDFAGEVEANQINLTAILPNPSDFGMANLWVAINGRLQRNAAPILNCEGELFNVDFRGYHYNNLQLSAAISDQSFRGHVELNDLNGFLRAEGSMENWKSEKSKVLLSAELRQFNTDQLRLTKMERNTSFSGVVSANLVGKFPNQISGNLAIDSFELHNDLDTIAIPKFTITAQQLHQQKRIQINSPILSGEVWGDYNLATIGNDLLRIVGLATPSLIPPSTVRGSQRETNNLRFKFRMEELDIFSRIFKLPIQIPHYVELQGELENQLNRFDLSLNAPLLQFGNSKLSRINLRLEQSNSSPKLNFSTIFTNKKEKSVNLSGSFQAYNDTIDCRLMAFNSAAETFGGELAWQVALLRNSRNKIRSEISVKPTEIIMNDTLWRVAPTTLIADSGKLSVKHFEITHADQFIRIHGEASASEEHKLHLNLRSINLDYIFDLINLKNVQFGGDATGDFVLSQFTGIPQISTENFRVQNFSFNQAPLGNLALHSSWNHENQGIFMQGEVVNELNAITNVGGYIFPTRDSLDLHFDAKQLNVAFIDEFTKVIFNDLSGRASGNVRLFGRFSRLALEGKAHLNEVKLNVDYLNTGFSVTDSIFFEPKRIWFKEAQLRDAKGNRGKATGYLAHDGFQDLKFNIQLLPQNMLVFNTNRKNNDLFHGTIYASGFGHIHGDTEQVNISLNGRTEPHSHFTFSLNSSATANDYQFITFTDLLQTTLNSSNPHTVINNQITTPTGSILNIDLQMEVTPEATLYLIMDEATGDQIKTNGNGAMRLTFSSTEEEVKLYGSYQIEKGSYNFNLQNLFNRDFSIQNGSTVTFRGDPLAADLDIQAIYTVTANLTDLDESFATDRELSRTNVPVNCLLKIRGEMLQPDLSFDVNLPTNSEDVNRRVKSLIGSPEMLNQQIIYLLLLNKFYTPDYANTGQRNELSAIASSTLSAQLNNILRQVNSNVNVGTNIRSDKGDFSDIEVELALSSQLLNNRLLINGNFGYRDNPKSQNNFIGDIDVEYKLTKAGYIRLKGYNKTNDRLSYLKSSLTTQGLGLIYKRDFDNLLQLLRAKMAKQEEKDKK